jgi:hypothetical protein
MRSFPESWHQQIRRIEQSAINIPFVSAIGNQCSMKVTNSFSGACVEVSTTLVDVERGEFESSLLFVSSKNLGHSMQNHPPLHGRMACGR